MNYCNAFGTGGWAPEGAWNNNGNLSPLDILGTQRVYGRKAGGTLQTYDGRCVDVRYGANADFTPIQSYDCQAATTNASGTPVASATQNWYYDPVTGTMAWANSGRVMDVYQGNLANGTPIETYASIRSGAQAWFWSQASLVGLAGKCVDVLNYSKQVGAQIEMWSCDGAGNQQIAFVPSSGQQGFFNIQLSNSFYTQPSGAHMCLQHQGNYDSAPVTLAICDSSDITQQFRFSPTGSLQAKSVGGPGLCLDVAAPNLATVNPLDGTMGLQMWSCNGTLNQQFSMRGQLKGIGGKCLDIPANSDGTYDAGNGRQLQLWDCLANQPNQVFTFNW